MSAHAASPRAVRRTDRGEQSRRTILETAARLATVTGLEGQSIGELALALGMSKSGLYAHFRSKEELQLATIEMAIEIYNREVIERGLHAPRGRRRILAVCDAFFDYVESGVFPGGCFFVYTSLDPATRRPAVRERLATEQREWLRLLESLASDADEEGELLPGITPRQLALELDSIMSGADANYVLLNDRSYLDHGRAAVRRRFGIAQA